MTIHKNKFEKYRKQLIAYRDALVEDLNLATRRLLHDENVYTDSIDQAVAETDKNFVLQMKHRDRNVLWQVDEALQRLEEGCYGDCERCGESISEGRMEVCPFTTLCIDCKIEVESEEHRFTNRH